MKQAIKEPKSNLNKRFYDLNKTMFREKIEELPNIVYYLEIMYLSTTYTKMESSLPHNPLKHKTCARENVYKTRHNTCNKHMVEHQQEDRQNIQMREHLKDLGSTK